MHVDNGSAASVWHHAIFFPLQNPIGPKITSLQIDHSIKIKTFATAVMKLNYDL